MKVILCLLFFLAYAGVQAQDKYDNYSFFKLYVTNDKDEVLLVKWHDNWEIAGKRYNDPKSIQEFLDGMANEMGITINEPKLCGMFTQRWKAAPLQIPPDCTDIKWFSYEKAMGVIPYQIMKSMMEEIRKHPGKIIGAAFERYKDENNNTQYVTLEDYHVMN